MPLREYICKYCNYQFEEFVLSRDPEEYKTIRCRCGSKAEVLPSMIGGINGVSLSPSRPKNSGAMKSKKSFTGHPGNEGEPETKKETSGIPEDKTYD